MTTTDKERELDTLIRYHQAGLQQYRMLMCQEVQIFETKTIEALEELKEARKNKQKAGG